MENWLQFWRVMKIIGLADPNPYRLASKRVFLPFIRFCRVHTLAGPVHSISCETNGTSMGRQVNCSEHMFSLLNLHEPAHLLDTNGGKIRSGRLDSTNGARSSAEIRQHVTSRK